MRALVDIPANASISSTSADGSAIAFGNVLWTATRGVRTGTQVMADYGISMDGGISLVSPDGRHLAGTGSHNGLTVGWVAALPPGLACYANCDGSVTDPVLNVSDLTCFLQKFAAVDPYANCDNSTTPPVLNVADFTCFLQKFAAGCP
jgi:hypothetical protein